MAFGQDFLKGFFGVDYLKDYEHASKTFTTAGFGNAPKYKFLFHVFFSINTSQLPKVQNSLIYTSGEQSVIGLLVKNIELPKYRIDTETLNQYNRKRVVQKKIEYQPIRIVFHDDNDGLISSLWYNYYAYHYKDPNQKYHSIPVDNGSAGFQQTQTTGFDYNSRDLYAANRLVNDWGFIGESYNDATNSEGGKPAFFRDISIYGFNQHKFIEYSLINPLISEWNHDTYDYSQGDGVMENTVTVAYETVKYYSGAIGDVANGSTSVRGFGDISNYDQIESPLSRPGGTRSVLGQGGLVDAGQGIIQDLSTGSFNPIGAMQTAGTVYGTFRGQDLKAVFKEEALGGIVKDLRSTQRSGGPIFNVPPR
jgi:hypothetical protein